MVAVAKPRTVLSISGLVVAWCVLSSLMLQWWLPSTTINKYETKIADVPRSSPLPPRRSPHYFPAYGSPEFAHTCPWALPPVQYADCTLFVRPAPGTGEGIAQWWAQIVSGFLLAQQGQCRFVLDYGPDVEILSVLEPASRDWRVPDDLSDRACFLDPKCFRVKDSKLSISNDWKAMERTVGKTLVIPPYYRFYYERIFEPNEKSMQIALPGFRIQVGFACAMGALFRLAEPLPAVAAPDALVLSLYIRTGYTDNIIKNPNAQDQVSAATANKYTRCAEKLEQERLDGGDGVYNNIVWQVVTDSVSLKEHLVTQNNNAIVHSSDGRQVTRIVHQSNAKGKHTRSAIRPSTKDFAEAVQDWWWIGESDLVIASSSYSFGKLATLRTARTLYDVATCQPFVPDFQKQSSKT